MDKVDGEISQEDGATNKGAMEVNKEVMEASKEAMEASQDMVSPATANQVMVNRVTCSQGWEEWECRVVLVCREVWVCREVLLCPTPTKLTR